SSDSSEATIAMINAIWRMLLTPRDSNSSRASKGLTNREGMYLAKSNSSFVVGPNCLRENALKDLGERVVRPVCRSVRHCLRQLSKPATFLWHPSGGF